MQTEKLISTKTPEPKGHLEILSRQQVAAFLQIGLSTLDTRIPHSELPRLKLGKAVRFLRSDVEAYLLRHRKTGVVNG
jgi:excisionase family DNA binding protein